MYVNPYWYQFPSPSPITHYALGILYVGLMIVACTGNGMVIYIFIRSKTLRTPANMFVVALAITDFFMMMKTPIFIYNSFSLGPVFGQLGCDIYGIFGAYSGLGSAFCNAAIAYDRFRVIACPIGSSKITKEKAGLIIIIIYLYITPFAMLPAFQIWGRFVPEGFLTSCAPDYFKHDLDGRSYIVCTFVFGWLIPICIICGCYCRIFLAVKEHERTLREQAKKMNVESLRSNQENSKDTRAEIKVAKAAFGVVLLFLFSWIPYIVVCFVGAFTEKNKMYITPLMSMIPAMTLKTSACFDPFMYAINHPKYRSELTKRLPRWIICDCRSRTSGSQVTSVATGESRF